MRTRIKICGITRQEDLDYAAQIGVDAIGLVFYPASGRYISSPAARKLLDNKPPFLSVVAVFMDAQYDDVTQVIQSMPVDYLQFHGSESGAFCASFQKPYLKSVPMGSVNDFATYIDEYVSTAKGFLLDSNQSGQAGGTGHTFAWSKHQCNIHLPLIVGGGLTAANVAASIRSLRPYAVDVSSGVELDKGVKDARLIKQFVDAVQTVDGDLRNV